MSSATMTISETTVEGNGPVGIGGNGDEAKLEVYKSNVSGRSYWGKGAFKGFTDYDLKGSKITQPAEYRIENGTIEEQTAAGWGPAGTVQISVDESYKEYDLSVAGTAVTSDNAADILGDGTVCYDAVKNRLTVSGDINVPSGEYGIINKISGLTVYAAADSQITTTGPAGIISLPSMTITGSGKLTVSAAMAGISVAEGTLTIRDADIDVSGIYGLAGNDSKQVSLIIEQSAVHLNGTAGAAAMFLDGIVLKDSVVASPEGISVQNGSPNPAGQEVRSPDLEYSGERVQRS